MKRIIILTVLMITLSSIASAIEVGGHLTEDTTWSPMNNPYIVTENLFVDSGVTLTILPGTEIKFQSAECTSWSNYNQMFWYPHNEAKMIWVDGKIIAEGTDQDRISFTRLQDDNDFYWGSVYFTENADFSIFKYCDIEYSAGTGIFLGRIARGALSFYNGEYKITNCSLSNNASNIFGQLTSYKVEVSNNNFYYDNLNYFVSLLWGELICMGNTESGYKAPLVAGNNFHNAYRTIYSNGFNFINNAVNDCIDSGVYLESPGDVTYIYDNTFTNFNYAISGSGEAGIYIRNNSFISGEDAININYAYLEIKNNYFESCDINIDHTTGKYFNNRLSEGYLTLIGNIELNNNISANGNTGFAINQVTSTNNNLSINNEYAFGGVHNGIYNNCIFLNNNEVTEYGVSGNPIFRNCIIDFELPPECIDGGGNIIIESSEIDNIFEDIEDSNFHLAANSIAIDAGFDTLGYYYPFDLDNSMRVWDGDGDGNAVIDIGAYEYGAPQLGKITGYITETISGEPVDYVLLKANNEPSEFTFADSSGYFEIQLPEGTYDLYAERVFYDDNILYTVTVENEQTTEIEFNMTYNDPLVGIVENEMNINSSGLTISNYPNPFNPNTTISFNLPSDSDVSVEIYNVKGQKVKTLLNEKMTQGQHVVNWNGLNMKNKPVSSGVYFYRVNTGNQESVKMMILLK